jgi:hypothetical protein
MSKPKKRASNSSAALQDVRDEIWRCALEAMAATEAAAVAWSRLGHAYVRVACAPDALADDRWKGQADAGWADGFAHLLLDFAKMLEKDAKSTTRWQHGKQRHE